MTPSRVVTHRKGYVLAAALTLAAPCGARRLAAQVTTDSASARARVVVRDAGPGLVGPLLRDVLAAPNAVVVAPDTGIVLGRGTDVPTTLVVIGGPARLEGRVRGDFVVLGDLVLRPGAVIDGRAIAIGGVILNSTLAVVRGDRLAFRDVGFAATRLPDGGVALDYRVLARQSVAFVALPGVYGLRLPSYNRVDGAVLTVGPEISLDTGRVRIDPLVSYRSHSGTIDPSLAVRWEPGRRLAVDARVERGTYTNERWIRGDLLNGVASLFAGSDVRNYYRAQRAELTVTRGWETSSAIVEPFVGVLAERTRSFSRAPTSRSVPWSLLGRRDSIEGMLRPNPVVPQRHLGSGIAGVRVRRVASLVTGSAAIRLEAPFSASNDVRFLQVTAEGQIAFPTFRDQRFAAFTHVVGTTGSSVPAQRLVYIGGAGTIPTMDLLSQGGDRLVWLESRYAIPIAGLHLPFVGSPTVTARHIVGGAGLGELPELTQNVGLRLGVAALRIDYLIDPARTSRHEFSVGFGLR